jgi:hypothetical protein
MFVFSLACTKQLVSFYAKAVAFHRQPIFFLFGLSSYVVFQINSNLSLPNFRTKQVDEFTARLLEIHEKMMAINKKEVSNLFPVIFCLPSLGYPHFQFSASFLFWLATDMCLVHF